MKLTYDDFYRKLLHETLPSTGYKSGKSDDAKTNHAIAVEGTTQRLKVYTTFSIQ